MATSYSLFDIKAYKVEHRKALASFMFLDELIHYKEHFLCTFHKTCHEHIQVTFHPKIEKSLKKEKKENIFLKTIVTQNLIVNFTNNYKEMAFN